MHADWLKAELKKAKPRGKTQAGLAEVLSIDSSAVSKMISGVRQIKADELPKIKEYLGLNDTPSETLPQSNEAIFAKVHGVIAGGVFREAVASMDDERPVPVRDNARYKETAPYALKVDGRSVNKIIGDGGYVICVPYWETRAEIRDNDLVHVERRRCGLIEATVKRVRLGENGPELWPESDDPAHQSPVSIADENDIDEVEIMGLVIGTYRDLET